MTISFIAMSHICEDCRRDYRKDGETVCGSKACRLRVVEEMEMEIMDEEDDN